MTAYHYVRAPLFDAIALGDVAKVRALLDAGFAANEVDESGETALHFAMGRGHLDIIATLLAANADVNAEGRGGRTPLFYAETADEARALLDAGAWIDVEDWNGHKPLYWAQSVEHALRLIEAGAHVDDEAVDDNTFVREAQVIHLCGAQQERFDIPLPAAARKRS